MVPSFVMTSVTSANSGGSAFVVSNWMPVASSTISPRRSARTSSGRLANSKSPE